VQAVVAMVMLVQIVKMELKIWVVVAVVETGIERKLVAQVAKAL
jgi:hypothetical protein